MERRWDFPQLTASFVVVTFKLNFLVTMSFFFSTVDNDVLKRMVAGVLEIETERIETWLFQC